MILTLANSPTGKFAANVNASVNVRRIGFATGDEVIAFHLRSVFVRLADQAVFPGTDIRALQLFRVRFAFDEHLDFATDKGFGNLHGNLVLRGHRQFAALLFHLVGKLAGHRAGARAVFLGIGENAEPLEFRFADEIQQRLESSPRSRRENRR